MNWTNVGVAMGEGALTSGVSAFKSLGAKVAVSAVSAGIKEINSQYQNGKMVDYKKVTNEVVTNVATTAISGGLSKIISKVKFRNAKANPSEKAIMHKRAGQMRYAKSTRRNARKRLKKRISTFQGFWEDTLNMVESGALSFYNRLFKSNNKNE